MNPDVLQLVDTSQFEIEAGDLVLVHEDKEKVKRLQNGHGEWVEDMAEVITRHACYDNSCGKKLLILIYRNCQLPTSF